MSTSRARLARERGWNASVRYRRRKAKTYERADHGLAGGRSRPGAEGGARLSTDTRRHQRGRRGRERGGGREARRRVRPRRRLDGPHHAWDGRRRGDAAPRRELAAHERRHAHLLPRRRAHLPRDKGWRSLLRPQGDRPRGTRRRRPQGCLGRGRAAPAGGGAGGQGASRRQARRTKRLPRPLRQGARGAEVDRRGTAQLGDRGPPLREREDGQEPRLEHPLQVTPGRPYPGRRLRLARGRRPARLKLKRRARAAGADGSRFRGLGTLLVGLDKALQVGVVRAAQAYLLAPGRGNDGGVGRQVGVGADQDKGLALCDALQFIYLVLREVWGVGDPDCPVLQGVSGTLVADRLAVVAAILPDRVVLAPRGWILRVVHFSFGVLSGRAHVVGLYVVRGAGAGLLPGVK